MRRSFQIIVICFFCSFLLGVVSCKPKMPPPPIAKKIENPQAGGENSKADPYQWLENKNDTAVQNYIRLENEYFEKYLLLNSELLQKISLEFANRADPLMVHDSIPLSQDNKIAQTSDGNFKLFVNEKNQVIAHKENQVPVTDKVIYEETGSGFHLNVSLSKSSRYFFIISTDGSTSETRVLPSDLGSLKPFLIQPRETGTLYTVEHFGSDIFWIVTNKNAENRKLMQAMVSHPEEIYWLPVVGNRDSVFLEDFTLLDEKYLLLFERQNPGTGIRIYNRSNNDEGSMRFKEPDGVLQLSNYDPEKEKILLRYTSMLSPVSYYEYNIKTGRLGIRKKTEIKNYVKSDYTSEILWTTASDGTKIPISLVYKKGLGKTDGSNPLLLAPDLGEPTTDPVKFNTAYLSLLDRGFYIAKVYLRKENASADYLQCADFLFKQKITSTGLLTGIGNGAGAKVLGDLINQHPEIFKAVILNELSGKTAKNGFPYESIKVQDYPAIMITAMADQELQCAVALKHAAKLRANNTGDHLILVNISGNTEPGGRTPSFCTFVLDQYDMNE